MHTYTHRYNFLCISMYIMGIYLEGCTPIKNTTYLYVYMHTHIHTAYNT